jgi:hypothetical protein
VSAGRIPRLRSVGPTEGVGSSDNIPIEVLRFATIPEDRRTLLIQVSDLLDQIDYGTVVIVMHEGNVTQVEMSEKIRLPRGLPDGGDRPRSG